MLCTLCFLAEQNDIPDRASMEIDKEVSDFSRTGIRLDHKQKMDFVGDFFKTQLADIIDVEKLEQHIRAAEICQTIRRPNRLSVITGAHG